MPVLVVDAVDRRRARIVSGLGRSRRLAVIGDGPDLLASFRGLEWDRPADVLLTDIDQPEWSHAQAWASLSLALPDCRVVAMTSGKRDCLLLWALAIKSSGLLLPDASVSSLRRAILASAAGRQFVDPGLRERIREALGGVGFGDSGAACVGLGLGPLQRARRLNVTRLSVKEAALLEYLRARQGEFVSVPELLEQVWGCSVTCGGTPQQVASCINRLRRKIEPDPHHPVFIQTVRGLGYCAVGQEVFPGSARIAQNRERECQVTAKSHSPEPS